MNKKEKYFLEFYNESLKIRFFENKLLGLFSKGLIKGTTHTCVGQENNAVGVCAALDKNDIVLSNHRCHGHFLSHTKNYDGLLNEILGKKTGVCGGIGGSQHLFYKKTFYSNGILGGNLPMAVGLAQGKKIKKDKNIVCVFLGDGAFGEGVLYECLNIISKYELPVFLVIEENGIAQTTKTIDTISGSIKQKCQSFNIDVKTLNYEDAYKIYDVSSKLIKKVKRNKPQVLILKSTRLGPHSKGDDTRSAKEISNLKSKDPILKLSRKIKTKDREKLKKNALKFIDDLFKKCLKEDSKDNVENSKIENNDSIKRLHKRDDFLKDFKGKRFGELINHYFNKIAEQNKKIIFLGEDITDPYGGAFKITKNIKNKFPKQIIATPISEASIVGLSGGLAIEGFKPIVEIMFGDFLSLAFDQILNNLSKFHYMYGKGINTPLVIRTPMGGGRGYGPTHSQSIEKHFFGITGLNIFPVNPFFPINVIYDNAFSSNLPSLVIENKLQYNFILGDVNKTYLNNFKIKNYEDNFISTFSISEFNNDEVTLVCYGGTTEIALQASYELFLEKEISCRIIVFSKLNEINEEILKSLMADSGPILTIEESNKFFGFGSEIGTILKEDKRFHLRKFKRLASRDSIIPASISLEKDALISSQKIKDNINEILNA